LPDHSTLRLALIGPSAQSLAAQLTAAGFDLGEGGAAAIDLVSGDVETRVALARQLYAPVVGIVAADGLASAFAEGSSWMPIPDASTPANRSRDE